MFPSQGEQTMETSPLEFGHARINTELDEIAPETRSRSDSTIAQYVFDKNYEVSIPNRSDCIVNNVTIRYNSVYLTCSKQLTGSNK